MIRNIRQAIPGIALKELTAAAPQPGPLAQTGRIGTIGPPRKINIFLTFFTFVRPTQKIAREGPKWGREGFFPAKKNLADILGRTDFDFENFHFFDFLEALSG